VRLFIAIDIPLELQSALGKVQRENRSLPLRFVKPEDIHLTLKFLGDVPDERLEGIRQALSTVLFEPFTIATAGFGTFAHALWLGVEPSEQLLHLQHDIERACLPFAPKDQKKFKAHLTLARFADAHLEHALRERFREEMLDCSWSVVSFVLYESRLTPEGPVYTLLQAFRASSPSTHSRT
jgi:RNA 2',3'-cyclic 3'-phosphodiesterase